MLHILHYEKGMNLDCKERERKTTSHYQGTEGNISEILVFLKINLFVIVSLKS